jgi:hypothetical protein
MGSRHPQARHRPIRSVEASPCGARQQPTSTTSPAGLSAVSGSRRPAIPLEPALRHHGGDLFSAEAVQTPARVNVTCVTPLGEELASTS